jgi:hypothetical protein
VGIGADATVAFENLGVTTSNVATPTMRTVVGQIRSLIASSGYTLVNATSVNPTVWVNVGSASLSAVGANKTVDEVATLLEVYGPGSVGNTVYAWTDASGNLNFGVIRIPAAGVTELFYVTIKP